MHVYWLKEIEYEWVVSRHSDMSYTTFYACILAGRHSLHVGRFAEWYSDRQDWKEVICLYSWHTSLYACTVAGNNRVHYMTPYLVQLIVCMWCVICDMRYVMCGTTHVCMYSGGKTRSANGLCRAFLIGQAGKKQFIRNLFIANWARAPSVVSVRCSMLCSVWCSVLQFVAIIRSMDRAPSAALQRVM